VGVVGLLLLLLLLVVELGQRGRRSWVRRRRRRGGGARELSDKARFRRQTFDDEEGAEERVMVEVPTDAARAMSSLCRLRRASASHDVTRQPALQPDDSMTRGPTAVAAKGCMEDPGPHLPFPATIPTSQRSLPPSDPMVGTHSSPLHGMAWHNPPRRGTSSSEPRDLTTRPPAFPGRLVSSQHPRLSASQYLPTKSPTLQRSSSLHMSPDYRNGFLLFGTSLYLTSAHGSFRCLLACTRYLILGFPDSITLVDENSPC